jgi:hypothetical protein
MQRYLAARLCPTPTAPNNTTLSDTALRTRLIHERAHNSYMRNINIPRAIRNTEADRYKYMCVIPHYIYISSMWGALVW